MLNDALANIKNYFNMIPIDIGGSSYFKDSGMSFYINRYAVEGLGNLSTVSVRAILGIMKMDTLILTPYQKDLPLFSYDYIKAMGNHTMLTEFYDTVVDKGPEHSRLIDQLKVVKGEYSSLPDHDLGSHWYDYLKLEGSVSKRVKGKQSLELDKLSAALLKEYLECSKNYPELDNTQDKKLKTAEYVNGLFINGGPSTDQFIKLLGRESAYALFQEHIFGIK